jgi:endonuclease-3
MPPRRPSSSNPKSARAVRPSVLRPDPGVVVDRLHRTFPDADTELHHRNAFELLIATVLSAQSSDVRVNSVTPALFERYPDARTLASVAPQDLEPLIVATGFFRVKARAVTALARALVEHHGGEVPASMEALTALPGVGRKTANVVLGHALGVAGLPVDRHVMRVATRIGIANGKTPERVEQQLCALLPPERWTQASDCLILHGRRVCRPSRPLCGSCVVADLCRFHLRGSGRGARRVSQAASR